MNKRAFRHQQVAEEEIEDVNWSRAKEPRKTQQVQTRNPPLARRQGRHDFGPGFAHELIHRHHFISPGANPIDNHGQSAHCLSPIAPAIV